MASETAFPRLPPSGIKVIIVGAGFGGLAAAIECDRKGHAVTVFEKMADVEEGQRVGDIISFDANGSNVFARWPGVVDELLAMSRDTDHLDLHDWRGELVTRQSFAGERAWGHRINGHRGQMHAVLWRHALARGIDVRLGRRVTDYFETAAGAAGVELDGGPERHEADVVLAAEGVRSRGRRIVLGSDDNPKSSGYAVYRAWFPSDRVVGNPAIAHFAAPPGGGDIHHGFIGPDIHFLASSIAGGKEVNWVFTHLDDGNIEESWSFPGRVPEALAYLDGWCDVVRELVKATPDGRLIDHKLVFRDPLPTFVSPGGRIALLGDAAHPFLPTSIQGASQSMEDGATLAVCLERAGKGRVPEALRAYERIRYDRVHAAQATGVATRERWHRADWDAVRRDPESLHLVRHEWLLNFNAEDHAYKVYDEVVAGLNAEAAAKAHGDGASGHVPLANPGTATTAAAAA
ncbi:hypothetical protein GGTG_02104 [Gaeumannomyces tritici R3-111a-1]|uniref:FAD-binding domain-containing protein n=1 Tax=Gaeumannomyces tritici (strain R3-111a-1) TaxID=644352 RepID=J3NLF5_GAET3|nr:hypothetical protein GGTG_02104 [Gaeumannomyces tritici R3-111a-1]EJT82130.1 hypothetical protein GGTG_02104 [Gaeumannomyces tritici R3-111a-1]